MVVPGCSVAKVDASRPVLGSCSNSWCSIVAPTVEFIVCNSAPALSVTVTVIEVGPSFSCTFSVSAVATSTFAFAISVSAKPDFVNRMSYVPGSTLTNTYRPSVLVVVVRVSLVALSRRVTFTPPTTPPLLSDTVPVIVPVEVDCPHADGHRQPIQNASTTKTNTRPLVDIALPPGFAKSNLETHPVKHADSGAKLWRR